MAAQACDDATDSGLAANNLVEAVLVPGQVAKEFPRFDLEALQDWRDVVGDRAAFLGMNGVPTPVQQREVVIQCEGQAGVIIQLGAESQQVGNGAR